MNFQNNKQSSAQSKSSQVFILRWLLLCIIGCRLFKRARRKGPARGDSDNFRAITRRPDSASASHVSDMFPSKAPSESGVVASGKRRDRTTKQAHTRDNSRVQCMYIVLLYFLSCLINKTSIFFP
jgi:hypothetical protein